MGFKRTHEGRVYFKNASPSANDEVTTLKRQSEPELRREPLTGGNSSSSGASAQQTQMQIIGLLRALNDKLKTTQTDRHKMRKELDAYRALIQHLEEKADRSERAYLDLEQKMSLKGGGDARAQKAEKQALEALEELKETRAALAELEEKAMKADTHVLDLKDQMAQARKFGGELSKRQSQLEKKQQEQVQQLTAEGTSYAALLERLSKSEERQDSLDEKVSEAIGQQEKLLRKIDKAIEDRARFMRKIERIEETVIQTRDAMNAKAMVLLTDQNGGVQARLEDSEALGDVATAPRSIAVDLPWWRQAMRIESAAILFLLVAGVLSGWLISEFQKPQLPSLDNFDVAELQQAMSEQSRAERLADQSWSVQQDTSAFSEELPQSVQQTIPAEDVAQIQAQEPELEQRSALNDDIGALDLNNEDEVLAALADDPDRVAAALNAIEPSAVPPQGEAQQEAEPASVSVPKTETQDSLEAKTAPQPARVVTAPPINISRDADLPEVVQDIEAQAFESIPEAQHDLAAIYIAGHAGVKQNYKRAAFWFEQAAAGGIANARYNLGVLYHQGLGVKADIDKAIELYDAAADLGHPEAQYNLGIAYIEGIGVGYDPAKAAGYFESAADQGVMEAAYNLGLIYENGLLGQPQPDEALMWYKTASDAGSPEAKAALEQLAKTLGISIKEVNKLADSMREIKKTRAKALETGQKTGSAAPSIIKNAGNQTLVAQVQTYLMQEGLYPGPADGVDGPLTRDAIRSYQSRNQMPVSGEASQDLLAHMVANADPGEFGSREE